MPRKRTCNRCYHKWILKTTREPKNCPHCKSPYWNKPRIRPMELFYSKERLHKQMTHQL